MESGVPEPSRPMEVARLDLLHFPPDTPLDSVFARVCEVSSKALDVERVGIWLFIDDGSALRCADLYERSKEVHSSGSVLRVADFPTYFASLNIRKAVPAEVAVSEAWTAELRETYLDPLGITSILDAGIFVDNTMVGVVCHENVGPTREWTTEARDFAGSVADLLAMQIKSAEARDIHAAFLTQSERLAAHDKTAALAQMAAGLAHDLKNLLTVFLGQGELLCRRTDLPAEARESAQTIIAAAERGRAMMEELLEFARPVARPPAVVDLDEVTNEILPIMQTAVGSRHEIRCSIEGPLGRVLIDKSQYTRLLMNLLVNARDAMTEGGRIDICLMPINLAGNRGHSGRFVQVQVSDRGAGMSTEARRRVFEPFFTTKPTGTGLGLAIVRQVVERAGGIIRVDSTPGRGTTFRIFFPCIGKNVEQASVLTLKPDAESDASGRVNRV